MSRIVPARFPLPTCFPALFWGPRGQPASRRVRGASRRTAEPGRDLAPSVRGASSAPGVLSRGEGGMGAPLQLPNLTPFTSARAFNPSGRPAKQSGPAKCCSRSLAWLPSLELRLFPLYLPQGACVHVHCVCTCVGACVFVCVRVCLCVLEGLFRKRQRGRTLPISPAAHRLCHQEP